MTTENQNKSERLAFPDTIPSEYGFITIDREFVNWPLFHDDAAWKIMCYLLMRANYKTRFWGTRTINQKGKKLGGWHFALHRLVDQGIYI